MNHLQNDTLHESRAFVLAEARKNIEFIKANPKAVGQAKQINTALSNIVAMERNMIMNKALERSMRGGNQLE